MVFANQNIQNLGKLQKFVKEFPKKYNFPKRFLLNRVKKIFLDLKAWGPLKNVKTRNGSYSGLSIYVKTQN
jgi:hypothetical protein